MRNLDTYMKSLCFEDCAEQKDDHQQFEELPKEMLEEDVKKKTSSENEELRIGIKDW